MRSISSKRSPRVERTSGQTATNQPVDTNMSKTPFIALALCAVGCSHYPAPTQQVASSMAAVRGAEEAGALQIPEGALHVKLAQEQIEQSRRLMEEEEYQKAEHKALRADSDAELAVAIARQQNAEAELQQLAQASEAARGQSMPSQPVQGAGQ
jgi:pyridoxal biosynthesis lyase PdxS